MYLSNMGKMKEKKSKRNVGEQWDRDLYAGCGVQVLFSLHSEIPVSLPGCQANIAARSFPGVEMGRISNCSTR